VADTRSRQAEVPVTALALHGQQSSPEEFREMTACGLRRDASFIRKFFGRTRPSVHQRREHSRASGVGDEGGHTREGQVCIHSSMVVDVFVLYKTICDRQDRGMGRVWASNTYRLGG